MSLQDPKSQTKTKILTRPLDYVDTAPTSTDNVGADTRGFRFARIDVIAGTLTGGTSWTATLQHSSDDGVGDAYADVESSPTSKTVVTLTAAEDGSVESLVVDLHATNLERYLKLAWANTGTFTVSGLAATITLFNPVDTAYLGTEVTGLYP